MNAFSYRTGNISIIEKRTIIQDLLMVTFEILKYVNLEYVTFTKTWFSINMSHSTRKDWCTRKLFGIDMSRSIICHAAS